MSQGDGIPVQFHYMLIDTLPDLKDGEDVNNIGTEITVKDIFFNNVLKIFEK